MDQHRLTTPGASRRSVDILIIGGGQAGLAAGYYLHRLNRDAARNGSGRALSFAILDANEHPGGAWQHYWDSLELFSPAAYSSLPGWPMPFWPGPGNPSAAHVVSYLKAYQDRYTLPVHRPVQARTVRALPKGGYLTRTDHGTWMSRVVINATGSWRRPFVPFIPGAAQFTGKQLHTTDYRSSDQFCGDRVLVVGGGNSGAQIAADLLTTASAVTWATRRPPRFLPDEIDGRALFQLATRHVQDTDDTENPGGIAALGDIVATPPIRQARDAGLLTPTPMFCGFTSTGVQWSTGDQVALDAVIWCTGFRPDLGHLQGLNLEMNNATPTTTTALPTQSRNHAGLFFLGYGNWCGPASATLIGVGAPARATITAAAHHARQHESHMPSQSSGD